MNAKLFCFSSSEPEYNIRPLYGYFYMLAANKKVIGIPYHDSFDRNKEAQ